MLLAECEMLLYGTLSTSRDGGATFWHERYAEGELSPVVRPCMCEHGEYKLYRTDRMGARREDRDKGGGNACRRDTGELDNDAKGE